MTGLEPATTGATVQCSTIELHPPSSCVGSGLEGIEPPTDGLEIRCSIRLSYRPMARSCALREESGGAGQIGARGFEPPTPCAQGRGATGLRHAPVSAGAECDSLRVQVQ